MHQLTPISGTRIVALPAALDAVAVPPGALMLRFAADEAFVTTALGSEKVGDPHAIVVPDAGFAGVWLSMHKAQDFLERSCEWQLPKQRPAFAQGMVAGIATKLWIEQDRVFFVVPTPFAHDFTERIGEYP